MNTPKLRFKEFSGEWEVKKLGDIATFSKGKGISKADIDENGKIFCIRYGELYTEYGETISNVKSKTNVHVDNLVLSEANDVIIPASGETQIDIATASCVKVAGVALGGDLNIIKSKENGVFLTYYLNNQKKLEIAKLAQGNSVVHLYSSQLKLLTLNLPDKKEQNKIANFLTAIDEKIAQLSQTAQLLTDYKKGVMQQIFSQQLRFKDDDGREFAEWEQITFSDFVSERSEISSDDSLPTYSLTIENGVTPKTERYEREHLVGDTDNAYKLVKQHDFAYNPMNLRFGAIAKYTGEGSVKVSKYYNVFYVKNTADATFFEAFIKSPDMLKFYDKMSTGSLIEKKRVHFTDFLKFKFNLPSRQEQTKIANFLTAIDDKINHNQTQLDAMKQYKSGLLQQMFV
jgi:type I restriction enzyme S subunit